MDLIALAIQVAMGILVSVLTGWFVTRLHKLEERIGELEETGRQDWKYIRGLIDFIYRNKLTPPRKEDFL